MEGRPSVQVTLSGELDRLSPAVAAATYRLAQESITNARRHAHQVILVVRGEAERVRLTVDDGATSTGREGQAGYGL